MSAAERLRDWILTERMSFTTEHDLQSAIEDRLIRAAGDFVHTHRREHRLDARNRIDFLPTVRIQDVYINVGIEVKIGSALAEVVRQLQRYAAFDDVDELLLVTTKAAHHHVPNYIGGKRVVLCSLVEGGL